MKTFVPIEKPEELDFFNIFDDLGVRFIHILGYSYKADTYWANMECSRFTLPLSEFITNLKENENYVDDTYCELNQYQEDFTAEEMTATINHYFNGEPPQAYLDFKDITMDTPCGNYVRRC